MDTRGCYSWLSAQGSPAVAEKEVDIACSSSGGGGGNAEGNGGGRKKLRLNTEQLLILERRFRQGNSLSAIEKQELAEKSGLLPRQVEVWFQNKRARTRMKRTEVDCEKLKKCCESLNDENLRLKEEVRELRLSRNVGLLHAQGGLPAVCLSCQLRLTASGDTSRAMSDDNNDARAGLDGGSYGRAHDGIDIDLNA